MFVTFFDTCMVSLTAIFVWRYSPFLVFLPWLAVACMDGTFISSVLTKVPEGAWVTILLASILASVFLIWRYGKEQQWMAEAEDRFPTSELVRQGPDSQLYLTQKFGSLPLGSIKGFGIFFDKAGETTPTVFSQFTTKLTAIPEVIVFFHLRPLEVPSVASEDRYSVSRLAIPNCYRLVVRYGYNDQVINPDLASVVYEQIRHFGVQDRTGSRAVTTSSKTDNSVVDSDKANPNTKEINTQWDDHELIRLDAAFSHRALYIFGKEQMRIKKKTNYFRKSLLNLFLFFRENSRTKMANLNVPTDQVIEVGFVKEI
jgi:KUP system potassium uptake protein